MPFGKTGGRGNDQAEGQKRGAEGADHGQRSIVSVRLPFGTAAANAATARISAEQISATVPVPARVLPGAEPVGNGLSFPRFNG
ncbi:hypothetical protein GCM10007291_37470 [Gemmobacter nanjingensis]|uniref:Uncharacterized protein n=1 Tax=Gemmobacter nanjingensis TaxID=488454 RepID=A0ABQ3FPT0_9RHOB|nr:hypothetical protein GCM10007291_37470 [Gemmobacter nanjingensis]